MSTIAPRVGHFTGPALVIPPGVFAGRTGIIAGVDRPVSGTTAGLIPGRPRTALTVSADITAPVTWVDRDVFGYVNFKAGSEGSLAINCYFHGGDNMAGVAVVTNNVPKRRGVVMGTFAAATDGTTSTPINLVDCLIQPDILDPYTNGVQGCGIRCTRVESRHSVDPWRAQGDVGVLYLVGCLSGDSNSDYPDFDHKTAAYPAGGPTHNDGGQAFNAIDIFGSDLSNLTGWQTGRTDPLYYVNPVLMCSQTASGDAGLQLVRVRSSWLNGGGATPPSPPAATLQILDNLRTNLAAGAIVDLQDNIIGPDNPHSKGNGSLPVFGFNLNYGRTGSTTTTRGNKWWDGTPLQIQSSDGVTSSIYTDAA